MSSAPHVVGTDSPVLLAPGVGVRHCHPGYRPLALANDQLCYVSSGRAAYTRPGERVEVERGTLAHFKSGWAGWLHVQEPLEMSYMDGPGAAPGPTLVLASLEPQKDWGPLGTSHTSGTLLSRDPDGQAESGLWVCTPGLWDCHVTRAEYCHFLSGRCLYTHESGEEIEIEPDTVAFFPQDWRGTCRVEETVTKVYLIR